MTGYLVKHKDGRHIAKVISDYTLSGGNAFRWTIHRSRAYPFRERELAEYMVEVAIADDPDCGAEVIETEET